MTAAERFFRCCFPLLVCACALAEEPGHLNMSEKLGKVSFAVSCAPAVQDRFNRAVAILHSFWYDKAEEAFAGVAAADPNCAMAHWGLAMSLYHQIWEPPVEGGGLERGWAEIRKAQVLEAKTERERGFINALAAYYKDADKLDHRTRALAYLAAMEQLHRQNPQDREVTLFYALSLIATAPLNDKTYVQQKKAGELLEPIYAEQPNHPGAAHYIIHAYDNPVLAERALAAARSYANIAPSMPHALHMPSHIFTRLGYWQEAIDSNIAAAAASRAEADGPHGGVALGEQFHAMDYLVYAYLQSGRNREAKGVLQERKALNAKVKGPKMEYATSAIPARYAVERRRWAEAADLEPATQYAPAHQAITYWARALGAAKTGNLERARQDLAHLEQLHQAQASRDAYWAAQIQIEFLEASAWLAHASGNNEEALRLARSAADLEDDAEKPPVTPGPVTPAREALGDLLAEMEQPKAALAEYEIALRNAPNRFNGLFGAARSAEKVGNRDKARSYYATLLRVADPASNRPELGSARLYLKELAQK
jgi:hypothetical protein